MTLSDIKDRWEKYKSKTLTEKYELNKDSEFLLSQAIDDIDLMVSILEIAPQGCICTAGMYDNGRGVRHMRYCLRYQRLMEILINGS